MRNNVVTYEVVCTKINEILSNGDKVNVRNVQARTGGGSARIAQFVKRWYDEYHSDYINCSNAISETLRLAVIADRNTFITSVVENYKKEISSLNSMLQESQLLLGEQEELFINKDQEVQQLTTQLIETNQSNKMYQELIAQLEHKLEASSNAQNNARTDAAKALLQLERADNLNMEMKIQIQELQDRLTLIDNAKYTAEKNSAVWQSKYEQLELIINRSNI